MSLIVHWRDKDYDVDPSELSQRELDLVEQRTGLNWGQLLGGGLRPDPNAIRALFWVVDQRTDPELKYSEYDGPPMAVWLAHLAEYKAICDSLGKLMADAFGMNGSDASPSDVDTPPSSTTG